MRLNPFARVETIRRSGGAIDGLRIVAPVKRRGLQTTLLLRADDEGAFVSRRRTLLTALLDAQSGRDPWAALSCADRDLLQRSGLFVGDGELPADVTFDRTLVGPTPIEPGHLQQLADGFARDGFAQQAGFVTGAGLAELQRYYRALVNEGYTRYGGEGGEPHRWVLHNDPLSRALHPSLAAPMSTIAGRALKPSFSYLLVYLEGGRLDRHRDRPQCDITAVLQVDFDPAPDGATPWPLIFVRDGQTTALALSLGDLIVFRGTQIEHYRDTFTCGRSSTSLAFCFVPEEFDGSLD